MRVQTVRDMADGHGLRLPETLRGGWPPELSAADERGWFRFQRIYDAARHVVQGEADMRRIVREAALDDGAEGSRWLEIQVDPSGYAARFGGITAFTDLVLDAVDAASRETGLAMAVVVAANKWDLEDDKPHKLNELREAFERLLPQLKGAPLVTVSAATGRGLDRLHDAIISAYQVWNRRITTAKLNQWLGAMTEAHPPPAPGGRRIRLRYMTQVKTRPPGFVLMCSHPDQLPESYRRYLVNGLRDSFDMPGTPIRLTLRSQSDKNPYRAKKKSTPSRLRKHVGKPIKT